MTDQTYKDLAYLFYYETEKQFYIELPDVADPWETPMLLSSFLQKGERTVNSYWSRIWVQQRIIPPDRQNISQILRDNGLEKYDEYDLLMLTLGRCEQDDYYLVPVDERDLPKEMIRRFKMRVEDVLPLHWPDLLVFFRDGTVRKCELGRYFEERVRFHVLKNRQELFERAEVQTGGYGVRWDENLQISDTTLYKMGKKIPLKAEDFHAFAAQRIITAAEAAKILDCSRQYINELVKTEKLHPVKTSEKTTLFLKSEVLKRNWK